MTHSRFEVQIDRVIVLGPELDEDRAGNLRALIEEAIRERLESVRKHVLPFEGRESRIDLPDLSPQTPEWERRVARATADAVLGALRGERK
jgi:hypothetical protein